MKKFSTFLKTKRDRRHLTWGDGDVVAVESLEEWTAEKPLKHKTNMYGQGHFNLKDIKHDPHVDEFRDHTHHINKSPVHREHMLYYKADSYSTNHYLRHGKFAPDESYRKPEHAHDHIKHMDHVTSYRTKHHHMTFRGGVPGDIHKFKPGHKFQDHGYTGTSFAHRMATSFHYEKSYTPSGKKIVHVIHSPPGTKAHHVDSHPNGMDHEQEMVLQRGTKFKVTHHSEDQHHHYIHSRVVGQHAKKMPEGVPAKHYSITGYNKHEAQSGITMTKHRDVDKDWEK